LDTCSGASFNSLRRKTFKALLDEYFESDKLKSILSIPVFGNTGLSSSEISAYTAVTVYKEFTLDGGYYPHSSIEKFPTLLAERFKELGGEFTFSSLATKIETSKNATTGVYLTDKLIKSKYVVSNADCRQTFLKLLGKDLLSQEFADKIDTLIASSSMYILYLGLDKNFSDCLIEGTTYWATDNVFLKKTFDSEKNSKLQKIGWFALRLLPGKKNTIVAFTAAPFNNERYWMKNKRIWMDSFIKKIKRIFPDLSKHIIFKEDATPQTLYKQTLNYRGARCGWASTPSQIMLAGLSQATPIKNLYLTGHWTTLVLGIPGVAYLGKDTARIILRKNSKKTDRNTHTAFKN